MCGISGYVGRLDAVPIALEGLSQLEYRGYDSAGLAVIRDNHLLVHKRAGKVQTLKDSIPTGFKANIAIAHTRWATHGEVNDENSHPHTDENGRIAVVHNGIIENAAELRRNLEEYGVKFKSDTDTEVLAQLIARSDAGDLATAVRTTLRMVQGTYGLLVLDVSDPTRLVAARNGSPMVIGIGEREMFIASDVAAFVRHTRQVVYLDDGEIAVIDATGYQTSTLQSVPTTKHESTVEVEASQFTKGDYDSYLRKEIFEQPLAVEQTVRGRLDHSFATARLGGLNLSPREILEISRIKILGCGSAYYAGMTGALTLERLARIPADAEPAPEFAQRHPVIEPNTLYVAVSQSGETADILTAVTEIQRKGGRVIGIVNVVGSSLARLCNGGVYLHAGPEISVASTKAVTCMNVAFTLLGLYFGRVHDLGPGDGKNLIQGLTELPEKLGATLALEDQIADIAKRYADARHMFFLGRVTGYPIALEGALKLKELSYIHAEGYPASELKHGAIALITEETPTVVMLPNDSLRDKNISTIQQVRARKGQVIAISSGDFDDGIADDTVLVPRSDPVLDPILLNIPLQLFAYHAAIALGCNIDQPRNLAKSVTVE